MRVTSNFKVDAIYDGMSISQGQRCIYKVTGGWFQYTFVQFHCEDNPEIIFSPIFFIGIFSVQSSTSSLFFFKIRFY